jgi:general secretion pathway protein I
MRGHASSHDDGFTIVEALVAFALLSLMLIAIYAASGTALRGVDRAHFAERAVLLAESKLAEIDAMRTSLPETSTGLFPGTDVRWRIDAKEVDLKDPGMLRLQELRLELVWNQDGARRQLIVNARHLGQVRE